MHKHFLFSAALLLSASVQAHDSTDWRKDTKAYASVFENKLLSIDTRPLTVQLPAISQDYMREKLQEFTGQASVIIDGKKTAIGNRGDREGRQLAVRWLDQEYLALGFTTSTQEFPSGTNFIAERKGSDPSKILIVSSHIDSVGNAGANDDGSGTIGALAIAQALKDFNLKYTLRIVGFDREEVGLVGSDYYVENLREKKSILGNIQVEMMATNRRKDGKFHIIDCGRRDSTFMTKAIMNASANLGLGLRNVSACTESSDHASFWNYDVPAVATSENFFGGDADPCYHAKCDVVNERIDWGYMHKITTAIGYATAEILGATPR